MHKKTILISIIAFLLIAITGIFVYLYIYNKNQQTNKQLTKENFTLTYAYNGDNNWEYTVDGTLPTPCFSATTDALVMESYPEQVKIQVQTSEDTTVEICSTVIKEYTYSGTFSASSKATISLVVE
ncbi:MAG: hypothetical protein UR96_C0031G0008 [candidate division WS6 bacterium GW2011_GWC1_36_11]|uniref:Uncharacterized protein n=3 Tax=Candidatus Dojkabacteria TaxID=74243 RepID=A0A0G0GIU5_9BACT|nr:MAG: hypothetical protein UR96_C0031G0008 [candidate division WS6 bacterium GW2011_GWC1_36_11]KKQ11405.1 MAG: hypothetical protein US24_C0028G0005 [candidate division WS6 bacterium GW2011_GWC2_36_7]KKQ15262.1 MAG: hypothetical protein US29_C0047G0002 [candidate division WS6 bacterium GW2011_GWF1_36_8]HAM37455.1 hypothetical protein [Patescibacteria group bacterium]HAM96224.1 hypothetical protein [Patescibacteria group bacterium]